MRDVNKTEKLSKISSLKHNIKLQLSTSQSCKFIHKAIGNSFLGSKTDEESKWGGQVGPDHFIAHQLLGQGSFGEVFLVDEKSTSELFAMKVLSKEKIFEQNLLKYAFAEKQIMAQMTQL